MLYLCFFIWLHAHLLMYNCLFVFARLLFGPLYCKVLMSCRLNQTLRLVLLKMVVAFRCHMKNREVVRSLIVYTDLDVVVN